MMRALFYCFLFTILAGTARADDERWAETNSWKGRGNLQTSQFRIGAGTWAIRHSHSGDGLFQVELYNAAGKRLSVPVNTEQSGLGVVQVNGGGVRLEN